jgi:hypothetical protein
MNTQTHIGTKPDHPTSAGGDEVGNGEHAKLTPVVLVIRDPDDENTFVVDGEVETIDIDLGRTFDGRKEFRALSNEAQREWIESTIAKVADLRVESNVRQAVEQLVEELAY